MQYKFVSILISTLVFTATGSVFSADSAANICSRIASALQSNTYEVELVKEVGDLKEMTLLLIEQRILYSENFTQTVLRAAQSQKEKPLRFFSLRAKDKNQELMEIAKKVWAELKLNFAHAHGLDQKLVQNNSISEMREGAQREEKIASIRQRTMAAIEDQQKLGLALEAIAQILPAMMEINQMVIKLANAEVFPRNPRWEKAIQVIGGALFAVALRTAVGNSGDSAVLAPVFGFYLGFQLTQLGVLFAIDKISDARSEKAERLHQWITEKRQQLVNAVENAIQKPLTRIDFFRPTDLAIQLGNHDRIGALDKDIFGTNNQVFLADLQVFSESKLRENQKTWQADAEFIRRNPVTSLLGPFKEAAHFVIAKSNGDPTPISRQIPAILRSVDKLKSLVKWMRQSLERTSYEIQNFIDFSSRPSAKLIRDTGKEFGNQAHLYQTQLGQMAAYEKHVQANTDILEEYVAQLAVLEEILSELQGEERPEGRVQQANDFAKFILDLIENIETAR